MFIVMKFRVFWKKYKTGSPYSCPRLDLLVVPAWVKYLPTLSLRVSIYKIGLRTPVLHLIGWAKVWTKALNIKYNIVRVLFFWLFYLPMGEISNQVTFQDVEGEKEDRPSYNPTESGIIDKTVFFPVQKGHWERNTCCAPGKGAELDLPAGSPLAKQSARGWPVLQQQLFKRQETRLLGFAAASVSD